MWQDFYENDDMLKAGQEEQKKDPGVHTASFFSTGSTGEESGGR